jgi:hypothetical protein
MRVPPGGFIDSLRFSGMQEGPGRTGPSVPVRRNESRSKHVYRLGDLTTSPLEIYHQAKAHGAEFIGWGPARLDGGHRLRLWLPNDFPPFLRDAIESCVGDLVAILNEYSEKTFPVLAAEAVLAKQRRLDGLLRWKREQHRLRMLQDADPIR